MDYQANSSENVVVNFTQIQSRYSSYNDFSTRIYDGPDSDSPVLFDLNSKDLKPDLLISSTNEVLFYLVFHDSFDLDINYKFSEFIIYVLCFMIKLNYILDTKISSLIYEDEKLIKSPNYPDYYDYKQHSKFTLKG